MSLIYHLLLLSVAIYLVAQLLSGVHLKSFFTSIWVALVYSLVNFLFGWLLQLLALPLIVVTLGLFLLVMNFFVNTLLLWITDKLIDDFEIDGLGTTFVAAVLITITNGVLTWVF